MQDAWKPDTLGYGPIEISIKLLLNIFMHQESYEPTPISYDWGPDNLPDKTYLHYLSEKTPDTRFTDEPLQSPLDTGGEYPATFKLADFYDGRYRVPYDWSGERTDDSYRIARAMHSAARGFLDITTGANPTPDEEIIARLPRISTSFRFVIDRRPLGHEDEYIPARTYTTYFANEQIPVAAPDHNLHSHDSLHAPSYAEAFSIPEFAEMVSIAAGNALAVPDESGCTEFTNAMDHFGDALIIDSIFSFDGSTYSNTDYVLNSARTHLQRLVSLYLQHPGEEPPKLGSSETAVFDTLWQKLGFAAKESRYGVRKIDLLRKYVNLDMNEPGHGTYSDFDFPPPRRAYPESGYDLSYPRYATETVHDFEIKEPVTEDVYGMSGPTFEEYRTAVNGYASPIETNTKDQE